MIMVGLSILLEAQKKSVTKCPQVINKTLSIKASPPPLSPSSSSYPSSPLPAITFLDSCFLCQQRLLPGKDIYMYKGDRAFCSVECRCRHILMDEESFVVTVSREMNCSATRPSSPSSCSSSRHQRKGNKKRANGFAY